MQNKPIGGKFRPPCLVGIREESIEPKTLNDFIGKFIEVIGRINASNFDNGELWQEFLVWLKQFELHVTEPQPLCSHVWLKLQELRKDILDFRAMQADIPKPQHLAQRNWFVLERVRPKMQHLMKIQRVLSQ